VDFYTYQYLRENGTPYYVGKGTKSRAFTDNSKYVPVPVKPRILIQYWGSESEALEMEKWWIAFWGRKDIQTGTLRNLTNGGEGISGYVATEEVRKKYSVNAKKLWKDGNGVLPPAVRGVAPAWNKGKKCPEIAARMIGNANGKGHKEPHSPEHCAKISATLKAKGIKPSVEACRKGGRVRQGGS
jgi:hypothetical protein